jgi:hypothetical protein
MPYSDPTKLAEIKKIAVDQQAQPGFASMAGKLQRIVQPGGLTRIVRSYTGCFS